MMAEFVINSGFASEAQRRQALGLFAAGSEYLKDMAITLANSPARTGIRYGVRKGSGGTQLYKLPIGPSRKSVRIHVASAPGEPPALLTGDLRRRRGASGEMNGPEMSIKFGSSVPYAHRLEMGGGAIAPRPAWAPTMQENFDTYMKRFTETFRRG
jgi:hypothetical protein